MSPLDLTPAATQHRPWPLPDGPWVMSMRWAALTFLHWPVPAAMLRPLVPAALEVDTYDGSAWVGVVPFRMEQTKLRGVPRIPGTHTFAEFNVRTYVRHAPTGRTGVWFFSLDAASWMAVRAARVSFGLPYFDAQIRVLLPEAGTVYYAGHRTHRGAPAAAFDARVRPTEEHVAAVPGSLAHWLTERYALFATRYGSLVTGDIHHRPWPLRQAHAVIEANTLAHAAGITLPDGEALVHYAEEVDVVAWPPRVLERG
ncbi:MAG: DUF2071 domain-containing protein [Bacteroidota bacterium]